MIAGVLALVHSTFGYPDVVRTTFLVQSTYMQLADVGEGCTRVCILVWLQEKENDRIVRE